MTDITKWAVCMANELKEFHVPADRIEEALRLIVPDVDDLSDVDDHPEEQREVPQRFPRDIVDQALKNAGAWSLFDEEDCAFANTITIGLDEAIDQQLAQVPDDVPAVTQTALHDLLYDSFVDAYDEDPPSIIEHRLFAKIVRQFCSYELRQDSMMFVEDVAR